MQANLTRYIRELLSKVCEAVKASAQLWIELLGLSTDKNNNKTE